MTTVYEFLAVARGEIGNTENPSGSNRQKYSASMGRPPEPWCADFVVWCARQVGLNLPSESAYTPTMAQGFVKAGTWHRGAAGPQPGDIVFFDFPDKTTGIQHVGIVEQIGLAGQVDTIEGNTSSGNSGSQDNGGGVYRRHRAGTYIVGYGRPPFAAAPPPAVVATPAVPTAPIPVHDFEEGTVKTILMHIGPLDRDGHGYGDWQPGLGRDPNPVAVVLQGPSPPDDGGYWPGQEHVQLSAQPRGGVLRVVVRGGQAGDTVSCWATVS